MKGFVGIVFIVLFVKLKVINFFDKDDINIIEL